jgi:2-polyprenyl-6-hydroxyphenyl methylase/3-demethylubiquinone-9 3-methyltransferase
MNPNQDTQTLAHFNAQAQDWWQKNGAMKTLHDINPARLAFVGQQIEFAGQKVLDIGCGGGLLSEAMAEMGAEVTGIDLACDLIQVAQDHANSRQIKVDYQCINVEALALTQAGQFDVVTCMDMLEHVPDPAEIIRSASQLLKPDGWLFVSTLNKTLKAKVLAVWMAEYVLRLLPQGTHDADQFITPHQIMAWARQHQLVARNMTGLHYNPLTRQARLALPADINYLVALQKQG